MKKHREFQVALRVEKKIVGKTKSYVSIRNFIVCISERTNLLFNMQ